MTLARLVLIAAIAVSAFAADATGKWKATFQRNSGPMEVVYDLKQDGARLTGNVTGPMGEMAITEGKVDGDTVTFTVEHEDVKALHKGTISGNEMKLQVDIGERTLETTAIKGS